jgi:hypothetical protein
MRPSRALVPAVPYARAHERGDRDPARVTPPFGQSVGVRYGRGRIIRGQGWARLRDTRGGFGAPRNFAGLPTVQSTYSHRRT